MKWKIKSEDSLVVATFLAHLCAATVPGVFFETARDAWDDMLEGGAELSLDQFMETVRRMELQKFDPDYDVWQ